ncbi:hypothetical protein O181_046649 [Austropuccinia psidii MF-1]|uniref:Uncharacterized protein n=1 Tax=Austropuccinia psidii MF-1 TaxID=1389203 RepID=A0A9Q3HLE9_9BASI|nr:hypothetical protein [Austropuccinia psidii MF-1]
MAKTTLGPEIGQEPQVDTIQPMASGNHQRSPAQIQERIPLKFRGRLFPSSMHPALKEPGVVHIWYNIPLCTIFAQQFNGDIFRTKLLDSKSICQSITNFKGKFVFRYSVWKIPGSYQKTIQGPQPPGPAGVGLAILIRTILRAILRGYQLF